MPGEGDVTQLLRAWRHGDSGAFDALVPMVYQELRRVAESHLRGENPGHTLSPTGLLHESFIKLMNGAVPDWQDRKHFFVVASKAMRQLLVDRARRKGADKRNAAHAEAVEPVQKPGAPWNVVDLDRALDRLAEEEPRRARMLELRHFGGLTLSEVAEVMDLSSATISRELRMAEAWLAREIKQERA